MGAEITYRCTGNNKYDVTLKIYRDCNSGQISPDTLLATCGSNTLKTAITNKVSIRDVSWIGKKCSYSSKCQGGTTPYGIEEHVWKTQLDLSNYQCCDWTISWQQCCRSSAITTGSAKQGFYSYAKINTCLAACNSSPIFSKTQEVIVCVNQDYILKTGTVDSNEQGDSLSFSLVAAMQNASQQVTYSGAFSPERPITFLGFPNNGLSFPSGLTLNPATGDLQFRPASSN